LSKGDFPQVYRPIVQDLDYHRYKIGQIEGRKMPEPHNKFGNALTIINNTRQLSPKARQILQNGSARSSGSVQTFFEDTFFRNEYSRLPPEEAETVSDDLHNVLEILEPLLELLEESRIQGVYPKYALAISLVFTEAYNKLVAWRCFEGWGQQIHLGYTFLADPRYTHFTILPLPKASASMKKCAGLMVNISREARSGVLSLVDPLEIINITHTRDTLCFVSNDADELSSIIFEDNHVTVHNTNHRDPLFNKVSPVFFERYGRLAPTAKYPYYRSSEPPPKYRVTFKDMVLLVSGLLDDVLTYSKGVKGEIASGQSVTENILTRGMLTRRKR